MVFGWLFGEKKRQETGSGDLTALLAQAEEATVARDSTRGEVLCREIIRLAPENADAWNMLGVNLIRRGFADPEVRAQAVVAWMRALALRPGDSRAADHLRTEIQHPEELVPGLIRRLGEATPVGDDAAAALAQIGERARAALDAAARAGQPGSDRARGVLAQIS